MPALCRSRVRITITRALARVARVAEKFFFNTTNGLTLLFSLGLCRALQTALEQERDLHTVALRDLEAKLVTTHQTALEQVLAGAAAAHAQEMAQARASAEARVALSQTAFEEQARTITQLQEALQLPPPVCPHCIDRECVNVAVRGLFGEGRV